MLLNGLECAGAEEEEGAIVLLKEGGEG